MLEWSAPDDYELNLRARGQAVSIREFRWRPDWQGCEAVRLIDVFWLDKALNRVVATYEVEHTSSIYSGIVRMLDFALELEAHALEGMLRLAPDVREGDVRQQLARPAFSHVGVLRCASCPMAIPREPGNHRKVRPGMKPSQDISRALA